MRVELESNLQSQRKRVEMSNTIRQPVTVLLVLVPSKLRTLQKVFGKMRHQQVKRTSEAERHLRYAKRRAVGRAGPKRACKARGTREIGTLLVLEFFQPSLRFVITLASPCNHAFPDYCRKETPRLNCDPYGVD